MTLAVTSITPASASQYAGSIAVVIVGTGFNSSSVVTLTKTGSGNISQSSGGLPTATSINCSFIFAGESPGQWNVVVTNSGGGNATLTNGFTIIGGMIQFGSLVLMGSDQTPITGKRKAEPSIQIKDTLLLSGKHSIQTNVNYGWTESYDCMGTFADYLALLGMIGQKLTLVVSGTPAGTLTYTKCAISGAGGLRESDNPGYYYWTVSFVQETV